MRLSTISVLFPWGVGGATTPIASVESSSTLHPSDYPDARSLFPLASGHEIHLPCVRSAICVDATHRSRPDDFLALTLSTENNALMVNKGAILPARHPLRLTAIKHSASNATQPEKLSLRYGMNILPMQPSPSGLQFRLDLMLFDQFGLPADTNIISIGLSQASPDHLRITMITINPGPTTPNCHPTDMSTEDTATAHGSCGTSQSAPGRNVEGRLHGSFTTPRPTGCESHAPDRYPSSRAARYPGIPIVEFVRFIYPVILPFLLGVVAGGAACVALVLLCRSAAYWLVFLT
ncbi:hypothetical protein BDV28DRAFT_145735 [Aspergillus coremiiformis]|uniref:Uncharacterized protein n=1 Tax=Aspergillus coremiiformis TaxID=138285 RepID=A0A5N6ZE57_9EURO|nr:hypothetical protein BDV28DRAFT_145735 [Aspergillus coremiiformis]